MANPHSNVFNNNLPATKLTARHQELSSLSPQPPQSSTTKPRLPYAYGSNICHKVVSRQIKGHKFLPITQVSKNVSFGSFI